MYISLELERLSDRSYSSAENTMQYPKNPRDTVYIIPFYKAIIMM
jgi:hypothetical protein